jgi:hypothetical protein
MFPVKVKTVTQTGALRLKDNELHGVTSLNKWHSDNSSPFTEPLCLSLVQESLAAEPSSAT